MFEVKIPYKYYNKYFIHYDSKFLNKFVILVNEEMTQYINNLKIFNGNSDEIKHEFINNIDDQNKELYNNVGFYEPDNHDDGYIFAYFDTEEEAFYFKLKFC